MKLLTVWKQADQENYQFNLKLRASIGQHAMMESRNFTKDERKFIEELEQKNDRIRYKYMTKEEAFGLENKK